MADQRLKVRQIAWDPWHIPPQLWYHLAWKAWQVEGLRPMGTQNVESVQKTNRVEASKESLARYWSDPADQLDRDAERSSTSWSSLCANCHWGLVYVQRTWLFPSFRTKKLINEVKLINSRTKELINELQMRWTKCIDVFRERWTECTDVFRERWTECTDVFREGWTECTDVFRERWTKCIDVFRERWTECTDVFRERWTKCIDVFRDYVKKYINFHLALWH